jgi:HK97 family phage portal protein
VTIAPANPAATLQVKAQGGGLSARYGSPNAGGPWPPMGAWPGPYVYDAQSARRIPAVGRALQLFAGLVKQMPMESYRGYQRLPQPRLLSKPDPLRGGPEFVGLSVEDYLLSGNALALVTARGVDGWPLTVSWLPAQWVYVQWTITDPLPSYYYINKPLPFDDVIHVRRSADRYYPVRGVGVVEEHLGSLDRVAMEEEYERNALSDGAVPSVAVVTPSATLTQDVADEAKANWMTKFSGPTREPVFLPNGTQVLPLAWSPTDTQLAEARRLSLIDVANMFNLDGYWLGAPVAGMTYRTAGPQYQQILRTSLEPVLADFEAAWSDAWLPRGTGVRFQRAQLLREDLATSTTAAVAGYGAGLISQPEGRVLMGLPPNEVGAPGTPDTPAPDDPNAELPTGEPGGAEQ